MLLGRVHKVTPEGIQLHEDINVCIVGDSSTPNHNFSNTSTPSSPPAASTLLTRRCQQQAFLPPLFGIRTRVNTASKPLHFTPSVEFSSNALSPVHKVFLAQLQHVRNDNPTIFYNICVGQGGNIYSFVEAFGEAMPPQHQDVGLWVDEVWQTMLVDQPKNRDPSTPL